MIFGVILKATAHQTKALKKSKSYLFFVHGYYTKDTSGLSGGCPLEPCQTTSAHGNNLSLLKVYFYFRARPLPPSLWQPFPFSQCCCRSASWQSSRQCTPSHLTDIREGFNKKTLQTWAFGLTSSDPLPPPQFYKIFVAHLTFLGKYRQNYQIL